MVKVAHPRSLIIRRQRRILALLSLTLIVAALVIAYKLVMREVFFSYALVNQDQVFRAIRVYAAQNQQLTPASLQDLIPEYFDDESLRIMADERAHGPAVGKIEYLYPATPLPSPGTPTASIPILKRVLGNGDIIESSVNTGTMRRKKRSIRG